MGVNKDLIPVNKPKTEVHAYHRDGMMRVDGNYGGTTGYQPNSYGQWEEQLEYLEPPKKPNGDIYRYEPKDDVTDDCFRQAGDIFRLIGEDKQKVLVENTKRNMDGVTNNIKYRHAAHCYLADQKYGDMICEEMGLAKSKAMELSKLSHDDLMKATEKEMI